MFQCCAEGEIERFLGVTDPRSESECRDDVRTICERQRATVDLSIKNNRVRFDAKLLNDCLGALEAPEGTCATISSMLPWTEACLAFPWVGTVDTGGQCDFAYECATDNVCNASRVCAALPVDGMPCVAGACASGLFCNAATCRPLFAQGVACAANAQCQKGLFCDTTATMPTCTPLHGLGERCTGNTTCTSNTCLPGTCAGSSNTCVTATSCNGHCADDNSICFGSDSDCGPGICSGTTTQCSLGLPCATGVCVFPKCLPPECVGEVVCAEAHITVDYCQGAVNSLPFF